MMSYWKRVDERLIKSGMLIMDLDFFEELMVGYGRGGWLRLQYPGSKLCSENISSPGSLDGWTQS
jgi:hypothetical protein